MTRTRSAPPTIVVDIGPGAGIHGGEIVAEGTPADIMANPDSADRRNISPAASEIADARSGGRPTAAGSCKVLIGAAATT